MTIDLEERMGKDDDYRDEARNTLATMFHERLPATAEAFGDHSIPLSLTETMLVDAVALTLKCADQEWGPAVGLTDA